MVLVNYYIQIGETRDNIELVLLIMLFNRLRIMQPHWETNQFTNPDVFTPSMNYGKTGSTFPLNDPCDPSFKLVYGKSSNTILQPANFTPIKLFYNGFPLEFNFNTVANLTKIRDSVEYPTCIFAAPAKQVRTKVPGVMSGPGSSDSLIHQTYDIGFISAKWFYYCVE